MNDQEAREQAARELIDATPGIPSLPEAAMNAGRLANDPESTTDELAAALAADPALCAHLLKVANSAFFGLRSEVSSVKHAVMVLGRKTLRSVALAASIQTVFPRRATYEGFSPKALWSHSTRTAGASSELAKILGVGDPEDAFVAGLVHDLGLLVMLQHPGFARVVDALTPLSPEERTRRFREIEEEILGTHHDDVGTLVMRNWGFPQVLIDAAAFHHDPQRAEGDGRLLAALVNAGECVVATGEHGSMGPTVPRPVDPAVASLLGTAPGSIEESSERMLEVASQVDSAFASSGAAAA